MGKYFGTDGVRGVANTELTCDLAYKLGRAGGYVLAQGKDKVKVIVGKDTRVSGDMLEAALVAGLMSVGCDVVTVGVIPTPGVAYLTKKYEADCGVVISASHNPVEYNGIKFFNSDGYKLSDGIENEIERDIVNSLIMPYLMVRIDSTGHEIEEFNNVKERIFTVDISKSDVIESKNRSIYISTGRRRGLRNSNIFIDDLCEESLKKEYICMFNNHTAAFRVAQVGADKIYIYNAIGIPKENIKYETEFVNRTKETYLNIKGEHKVEGIGFENEIDVHLLIDTDVYDKYEVDFHDGLVFVFLHEIINEKPVLEDVSSEKGE